MLYEFSAQIEAIKANSDKTVSIKLGTQEMPPSDTAHIFGLMEKQIWVALAETAITKEDLNIPEVVDEMDKKSPSQRLRDRMFVYWRERKPEGQFDDWYKKELERIGGKYLEKIQ